MLRTGKNGRFERQRSPNNPNNVPSAHEGAAAAKTKEKWEERTIMGSSYLSKTPETRSLPQFGKGDALGGPF